MRLFQNLKAFSIFKLRPIPSGSESFQPIVEASRSPILDPNLSFFKKFIILSVTTTFISLKTRKEWFSQGFAYKSASSWQKINFLKNERSRSKIGLLEASRNGLKLSDPERIGRNLKIEKAFRFWNRLKNLLIYELS